MQNIKAIINNDNMNTLHQNKDIKDEYNCRNKKYCLKVGMFVAKYSLPIARTSSKIFLCKSYCSVLTNIAPHCLTDVLNSNSDKTSIKQLQVVLLRMNIAERVT